MRERTRLHLAIAATVVLILGAITNGPPPLAASGVALDAQGITFPDGTFQATAYTGGGELVQGTISFVIPQLSDCSGLADLIAVPAGKVLEISWLSVTALSPLDVDPVRVWIRTWTGITTHINHPVVLLENLIRVGPEIFEREGWHSQVTLTSVEGQAVKVWGCKADYLSEMDVTVTFTGRLYDVALP